MTGASVLSELEGVISMVASLSEGVGLSAVEIRNVGPLYKSIIARCHISIAGSPVMAAAHTGAT